jgi:gamma-glutamyltranspeptidase
MDDFSLPSASPNAFDLPNYEINYIEPGKRPVSSMAPSITLNEDKSVRLVCGASGGTRILSSTAMV